MSDIKYFPQFDYKYVVRDGVRYGPFLHSTEWTKVEKLDENIFTTKSPDAWRKVLSKAAFNKGYEPP